MLAKPFEWMVQHYYENVLPRCTLHLKDGKICDANGEPLKEGPLYENPHYKGFIFAYNGDAILAKASELMNRKRTGIGKPIKVESLDDFVKYFGRQVDVSDQKYLYNSKEGLIYPLKGEYINNYPHIVPDPEKMIEESFPYDFLSNDGSIPVTQIGTKSYVAALIAKIEPKADNKRNDISKVETILLNQTPKGAGMGMLSHFDETGVVEDFHVDYDPILKALVGTYRQRDKNGKMVIVKDPLVEKLNKLLYGMVVVSQANPLLNANEGYMIKGILEPQYTQYT